MVSTAETALKAALLKRNNIIDQMLSLKDYRPGAKLRFALTRYLVYGATWEGLPARLRRAQEKVLELIQE